MKAVSFSVCLSHSYSFPPPLCTQVHRPCPATWPTSEAPRRKRTWRRRTRRRRKRWGTESTLTAGEAAARPRPPPRATRHRARASSPPGSRSTGTVRTWEWSVEWSPFLHAPRSWWEMHSWVGADSSVCTVWGEDKQDCDVQGDYREWRGDRHMAHKGKRWMKSEVKRSGA